MGQVIAAGCKSDENERGFAMKSLLQATENATLNETARPVVDATDGPNRNASLEETRMAVDSQYRDSGPLDNIQIQLTGCDTASSGGVTVACPKNALTKLCRKLVSGGADPFRSVDILRDGTLCFRPTALGWWAGRTASEGSHSARIVPYVPMPDGLHNV